MSRNLVKVTGALASVVLLGGCAAGTHPGAAAQVGKTQISVTDVDETSRAVTGALGQPYTTGATLSTLVNTALVKQITDQRSITISDADIAQAMTVLPPEGTYDKFVKDPKANAFLHDLAESVVGIIKLGGGTGVKDPNVQQAQQAGQGIVLDASKTITVDIAPRFGKWKDGAIDGKVSGSLSNLSDQTKAAQPADPSQQDPSQQQDPNQPPAEPQG